MKKLLLLSLFTLLYACDSTYDFDLKDRIDYGYDEEGDPVIDNIEDDAEIEENFQFGLGGGFCYGFNTPDAEEAEIIELGDDIPSEHDLSEYLPEVRSQGKQGSCVAWATGYYLKSFHENYEDELRGIFFTENEMSPAYIYNQIKVAGCADGSVIQHALDTIVNQGIPDWAAMPYDQNECDTQPDDAQKLLAEPNIIEDYSYIGIDVLLEQTKAYLLNDQPVVIAITIDRNYFGARDEQGNHIYRKFKNPHGGHAMLVVGYSDEMNAFKVVNSWGKEWGNEGFVWLDYKAFSEANDPDSDFKVLCEAWVTTDYIEAQLASL